VKRSIHRAGWILGAVTTAAVSAGCKNTHTSVPTAQPAATPPVVATQAPNPTVVPPPKPKATPAPAPTPAPTPAPAPAAATPANPGQPTASSYVQQAQSELTSGANDVAIETAKQALQIDDRDADAMAVIGVAEFNEGNVDLARYALDQALAIDPQNADANNTYGMIDQTRDDLPSDTERIAAAIQHFQAATQSKPDYAAAWNNLGAMYLEQKQWQQAEQALEHAVKLRPNWSVAQMNLGSAYRGDALTTTDSGQHDQLLQQSEQSFMQAGTLDPSNADVHFNLGILYLDADPFPGLDKLTRLQKAIDELTRYQQILGPRLTADDPTQAPNGGYLADAHNQFNREQKAEQKKQKQQAAPAAGATGG
jgi:Tfp pilus assembly protein PilF